MPLRRPIYAGIYAVMAFAAWLAALIIYTEIVINLRDANYVHLPEVNDWLAALGYLLLPTSAAVMALKGKLPGTRSRQAGFEVVFTSKGAA